MIILIPKIMSKVQVTTEMILIKNNKLKHTNSRIIHIIILKTMRMSQVQVIAKMILMEKKA